MRKLFTPLAILTAAMLGYAPIAIANAPYESTMLLVQKIFYFHLATWMALATAVTVCAAGSVMYLFKGNEKADRIAFAAAELSVVYCTFGLISGSLWGRKAWGVWWQWDAKLTMAFMLEMIFLGYLIVRKYAGPGAEKLAAAMGIFGAATAPFIYKSVDWWRTIHPQTTVMKTLGDKFPAAWNLVWFCSGAFLLLFVVTLAARVRLEQLRAQLDRAYLAAEE
jgi:heme exporter protein C